MVGATAHIRKQDRERFETIKVYCGCLCNLLMGYPNRTCTIEHITVSGRRVGDGSDQHQHTIGLSAWNHLGHTDEGVARRIMDARYGPSLADGRRLFEEFFGDELLVLLPVQNYLLKLFAETPWGEYDLPRGIEKKTRRFWVTKNYGETYHPSRITVSTHDTV